MDTSENPFQCLSRVTDILSPEKIAIKQLTKPSSSALQDLWTRIIHVFDDAPYHLSTSSSHPPLSPQSTCITYFLPLLDSIAGFQKRQSESSSKNSLIALRSYSDMITMINVIAVHLLPGHFVSSASSTLAGQTIVGYDALPVTVKKKVGKLVFEREQLGSCASENHLKSFASIMIRLLSIQTIGAVGDLGGRFLPLIILISLSAGDPPHTIISRFYSKKANDELPVFFGPCSFALPRSARLAIGYVSLLERVAGDNREELLLAKKFLNRLLAEIAIAMNGVGLLGVINAFVVEQSENFKDGKDSGRVVQMENGVGKAVGGGVGSCGDEAYYSSLALCIKSIISNHSKEEEFEAGILPHPEENSPLVGFDRLRGSIQSILLNFPPPLLNRHLSLSISSLSNLLGDSSLPPHKLNLSLSKALYKENLKLAVLAMVSKDDMAAKGGVNVLNYFCKCVDDVEMLKSEIVNGMRVAGKVVEDDANILSELADGVILTIRENKLLLSSLFVTSLDAYLSGGSKSEGQALLVMCGRLIEKCAIGDLLGGGERILPLISSIIFAAPAEELVDLALSLLSAILELGAGETRPISDKKIIAHLLPKLREFADASAELIRDGATGDTTSSRNKLGEMAAHCIALITMQKCSEIDRDKQNENINNNVTKPLPTIAESIESARLCLLSTSPPERASAAVALTKLVSMYVSKRDERVDGIIGKRSGAKITVVPDEYGAVDGDNMKPSLECSIDILFDLLVLGLNDEESYVYLAAVNGLDKLADVDPSEMLLKMAKCVSGRKPQPYKLQATIGEALHFSFRRRSGTLSSNSIWARKVINELLWGLSDRGRRIKEGNDAAVAIAAKDKEVKINVETANYYLYDKVPPPSPQMMMTQEDLEDYDYRLKSANSVFSVEESDVSTSSLLSVVATIVQGMNVDTLVSMIPSLMPALVDTIRLATGRSTLRGALSVAHCLYGSACWECKGGLVGDQDEEGGGWGTGGLMAAR